MWSEWGSPDAKCGVGEQKRTTMCGALRRRLPLIEDNGEPPVYWPSCLMDKFNEAEATETTCTNQDKCLEDCMFNCLDDCRYWTYNKTSQICYYSKLIKSTHDIRGPEIVTGSKQCKSTTLYFPHCAKLNLNYTEAVSIHKLP